MKTNKNPLWRKIITIVFLPIIIIVWTIGWTLTIIGANEKTTKIRERPLHNYPECEADKTSNETPEDSNARYEKEIIV